VRPAQGTLDLEHRFGDVGFRCGERADVVQPVVAEHLEAAGHERDQDLLVGIPERRRPPLGLEHADHLELLADDPDVVAKDLATALDAEQREHASADHGHSPARVFVGVGEHLAILDLELPHGQVVRRGSDDVDVGVPVAPDDAQRAILLRLDGGHVRRVFNDHPDVCGDEPFDVGRGNAPLLHAPGVHFEQCGSEAGDASADRRLGAIAEGNHGDHGANADHDAEHREQGPHFVGAERVERHAERLADQHDRPHWPRAMTGR